MHAMCFFFQSMYLRTKVFRTVPLTGVYNCVLFRTVSVKGALCGLLALICVMW